MLEAACSIFTDCLQLDQITAFKIFADLLVQEEKSTLEEECFSPADLTAVSTLNVHSLSQLPNCPNKEQKPQLLFGGT